MEDLGKLESLQELVEAIDMGLDIEFYLFDIRYNISWQDDNNVFICICPDGPATYYPNGKALVDSYKVSDKFLLKDVWQDMGIWSM